MEMSWHDAIGHGLHGVKTANSCLNSNRFCARICSRRIDGRGDCACRDRRRRPPIGTNGPRLRAGYLVRPEHRCEPCAVSRVVGIWFGGHISCDGSPATSVDIDRRKSVVALTWDEPGYDPGSLSMMLDSVGGPKSRGWSRWPKGRRGFQPQS